MQAISEKRLKCLDAYWRAANYLSVGQIYLRTNPLLRKPLALDQIKKRILGHWGTSPGLNFIYAHLNRLIQDTKAQILYVTGPGHGGPALRANVFLEGAMEAIYPKLTRDMSGVEVLMREFSWPGGVPSHVSPPTPGSIHEGGELGYSLAHAFGAAFDHPDLIVACVVGDGEAETGPLAASWQSIRFLHPVRDGAVVPILHLNGYKISGPTLLGRMDEEKLIQLFSGYGYAVHLVSGDDPFTVHRMFWATLDKVYAAIRQIKQQAHPHREEYVQKWPMIILRTPKGWTGPKKVDGKQVEGTFRAHQVPVAAFNDHPEHLELLAQWMKSYQPDELFDAEGRPTPAVLSVIPEPELRMGGLPYANGGELLKPLDLPNHLDYMLEVKKPGQVKKEATRELGKLIRDLMKKNGNFRLFCPDETQSNRLQAVFDVTGRTYLGHILESDENLKPDGRVMEVLSEHLCQGWLEGYLLTGRHGLFPCYEAFALIIDSMVHQHGKWLKACRDLPWRKPIASLNYLLTSHAWRQDHNGYSHQGPGFIESILQKKGSIARIYLPPDANCLLAIADHCLRSCDYINLIIAGKQPMPQWLNKEQAKMHCAQGASIWDWASVRPDHPDIIFAAAGDTPTLEMLAGVDLLRRAFPQLNIRVINVVDLLTLLPHHFHPHGFDDKAFEALFGTETEVIFAFHGHPRVIHELTYKRPCPHRFHVRGYIEEGTTTTPFDMVVVNEMSRFHLAIAALNHLPQLKSEAGDFIASQKQKLAEHRHYIAEHGEDMPEIQQWTWES